MLYIIIAVIIIWALLTFWAESKGKAKQWTYGKLSSPQKVLIIYDPDPFYNLDEQLCRAFAEELRDKQVIVATVAAAEQMEELQFDLYVLCTNTYNWQPDWALSRFVKKSLELKNKPVIAITLGSGSTGTSQKTFEKLILKKEANLVDSRSFWLLKPNDENRLNENNVKVAVSMVHDWARGLVTGLIK